VRRLSAFFLLTLLISLINPSPAVVEAAGGSYTIKFEAADPDIYIPPIPYPGGPTCPTGRGSDPLPNAYFANPITHTNAGVTSLSPENMALGAIVPFEIKITVAGSVDPENGQISLVAGWKTETTAAIRSNFGFDEAYGVLCAFIDTADGAHIDPGANATVSSFSWSWVDTGNPVGGDEIQGTFNISGLNDGDVVILEVWLVLQDFWPIVGASGNVQARLINAQTSTGAAINTGNQTVPLLRVGEFVTSDVDIAVVKADDPDPVLQGGTLKYPITVTNSGPSVANGVVLTDVLDPNTSYVSYISDPGSIICSENPSGTVTCDIGALAYTAPDNTAAITLTVSVDATAPISGTERTAECTVGQWNVDLCNSVSVTTISDDTNPANNSDTEPTDVVPIKYLKLTKYTDDQTLGTFEPKSGWVFTSTVTISETSQTANDFEWLNPVQGLAAVEGTTISDTTAVDGSVLYEWVPDTVPTPDIWNTQVQIDEELVSPYNFHAAQCWVEDLVTSARIETIYYPEDAPVTFELGPYEVAECDYYNSVRSTAVILAYLDAVPVSPGLNKVTWVTSFEQNVDLFKVYRVVDSEEFSSDEEIGEVSPHGVITPYNFYDKDVEGGTRYCYWIKEENSDIPPFGPECAVGLYGVYLPLIYRN
jgi:uncharacterized repeat protein (TIGR01451 family)